MNSIVNIIKKLRENRILQERADYESYELNDLIRLAQDGDQLATDTLIKNHKDFIKRMSSKYVLDTGDKDDVEQLATIGFWEAINSYNPDRNGDFEAYAGMIIKRKMIGALRKDSTEKAKLNTLANSIDDTISSDGEGGEITIGDTIASKEASPEEQYLGKSGARELMEFMRDKFSQAERDVVMRYIRGYKVSEIAEETGMKYKSVENALMRVKNKLADYLRARESKKIKESQSIFSEEEKRILESVITKVNEQEHLREHTIKKLKESYENYTSSQIDNELDKIEEAIEDIIEEMRYLYYDERDDQLDELDDLRSKLYAIQDYANDEQYDRSEELLTAVMKAEEDTDYEGPEVHRDPYKERGLKQSDFI